MTSNTEANTIPPSARWFRWAIAFVWLSTGVLVLHPEYREIGARYLHGLGLPSSVMYATCVGEILLGLWVACVPAGKWVTWSQVTLIVGFTAILAVQEPLLLAHPMGVLSKNVPLVALIISSWLLQRQGWTPRTEWLLRLGMAVIWITEGLFPKILFQQQLELDIVNQVNPLPIDAGQLLVILGACQIAAGIVVLTFKGRLRTIVLTAQLGALVILPVLVSVPVPTLWVHPFGPLTKNVPIMVGTLVVLLRSTPFLSAQWSNVLLVTYPVERQLLAERLPPGVELDTRDGHGFVSLVSLDFRNTRVLGVPCPGFQHFPDINLRCYVHQGRRPGVVFIREFVPMPIISWVARVLYQEPFEMVRIRSTVSTSAEHIVVVREFEHSGRIHTIRAKAAPQPTCPPTDSDEHFFKERYWGFGRSRTGNRIEFSVDHPLWEVSPLESWTIDVDWANVYGAEWSVLQDIKPVSAVFAVGSPVRVWFAV